MKNIGANLKFYREKAGLTQQDVGDKLDVAKATVGHWENNKRTARLFIIESLAKLYNTTTANLIGDTNFDMEKESSLLEKIILDLYDENILEKDANLDNLDSIHKEMLELALKDFIKKLLADQ